MDDNNEYPENWDECICNDCGHIWYASDDDHFNFTTCDICSGEDIGGKYHEN